MEHIIVTGLVVGILGFAGLVIATILRRQYSYAVAFALAVTYVVFGMCKVAGIF